MKINLEFANDLATTGSYVKSDSTTGKDKGALAYWDKFDVRLDFYYYIGGDKNYLLRSGVMLSTTSYTEGDNKGDAYVNTVTKFSIPVRAVIKF